MKILIVASAHSVHVRKIANFLAELGHNVAVFSEEPSSHPISPQQYLPQVNLYDRWPARKLFRKLLFLLRLNLHSLFTRVDVVWFVYASSYGLLAPRVYGPAYKVVSVWGSDILINSYKRACAIPIGRALDAADLIFSTSSFLRLHTVRLTYTPAVLTPYGPEDIFYQADPDSASVGQIQELMVLDTAVKPFKQLIVCTKWLKHVYGLDILFNAVATDPDYFRRNSIGLVVAGEGQDEASLRELVDENNISDIVIFTGHLSESGVIGLLDRASLAVYPSRSESFGVSVLECFARKVPVIMSAAGGFREIGRHGEFGVGISSDDPLAYLTAIKDHFTHGCQYDIGAAADYSQEFRWSTCVPQMEKYLLQLVAGKRVGYSVDFGPDSGKEKVVYLHSESAFCERDKTRARSIRVTGMRNALATNYNVIELGIGIHNKAGLKKLVGQIFDSNRIKFVYVEGTAGVSTEYSVEKLRSCLLAAEQFGVPFVYYLPDAHEYWDEYCLATNSAYKVHHARSKKAQLIEWLAASNNVSIAVPTAEFRSQLLQKLPTELARKLSNLSWLALPPALEKSDVPVNVPNKFAFVYAGGLGAFYLLHRWLIAISETRSNSASENIIYARKRDLRLLTSSYRNLIKQAQIETKHRALPPTLEGKNYIGVLLLEPTEYIAAAIPLKFFSYLERGWPILAYENTHVGLLVAEHGLGWVLPNKVAAISYFLDKEVYKQDHAECQKNIIEYRKNQMWSNRLASIEEQLA